MTRVPAAALLAVMIVLVLLVSGCSTALSGPPSGAPSGAPSGSHSGAGPALRADSLPADCPGTITEPALAVAALAQVRPGGKVCLSGDRLAATELVVRTSGTPQQPITVVADGAAVRSLRVEADHVVVDGLSLVGGDGLTMAGRGLHARYNVVHDAAADGIVCIGCVDTTIESNTITRADGTGIYLAGERITVRNNTVRESLRQTQGDADGIRFFGPGHRLIGNTVADITQSGYGADPRSAPHTDCFQTYNTPDNPPTTDVLIADNRCTNVGVQCLIATAERGVGSTVPPGGTAITFEDNICEVDGAQAILLENFPHVVVRANTFSGPGYRAVLLTHGSTDCVLIGNTVGPGLRPYEVDESSNPRFEESGNVRR